MSNEFYALICFLVLTDHWSEKHWTYLDEKRLILRDGLNAFAWLDYHNMEKVINYLQRSNSPVPIEWQEEYDRQKAAAIELGFL